MKIEGRTSSFVLTGDASKDAEEDLAHLTSHLKSTVIKVPHHGGRTSVAEGFLHYVSPDVAVISAGRNNPYGHPHPETLDTYSRSRIYRTDKDGAVSVEEFADGALNIKTWRELAITEARNIGEEYLNMRRLFNTW